MEHFRVWSFAVISMLYLACGLMLKTRINRYVFPSNPKLTEFLSHTFILLGIIGIGCIWAYVRYTG